MQKLKIYWLEQNMDAVPSSLHWLHPAEKEVLSHFKFPKKSNDWILGRWTAKNAIKQFLYEDLPTLSLSDIEVRRAEDGAPEPYLNGEPLPVYISLSHSHGIGFCTISDRTIIHGCDVEYVEPRSDAFISDYLTDQERNILARNADNIKPLIANIIWSTKESTMKLLRTGLSIDTRKVNIYSIKNESLKMWNDIRTVYEPQNQEYFGHWKARDEIIFTIVTEDPSTEIIKLPQHLEKRF